MTDQPDLAEVLGRLQSLEAEVAELHAENRRLRHLLPATTRPGRERSIASVDQIGRAHV